jgi:hypothetical protein
MANPDVLVAQLRAVGLPEPVLEHVFAPPRRWRFDLAWPDRWLACEIEGATWSPVSRHTRGAGYHKDLEKYNRAALNGWTLIRVTTNMVADGRALALLEEALGGTHAPAR